MLPQPVHLEQKDNHQRRWSGLPEMVVYTKDGGSQRIAQSTACLRYMGSITGLYPADRPLEAAMMDEVMDSVEDVINGCFVPIMRTKEEDRQSVIRKLMSR